MMRSSKVNPVDSHKSWEVFRYQIGSFKVSCNKIIYYVPRSR